MAEQPRGTVTMLFTDIEGSTRLLERLGPVQYGESLELHRRLLRDAFKRHGGWEVHYEGDAFFVAFERAGDAIAAAQQGQQALAAADWPDASPIRVRMGIHTGEPLVAPPKYVGLDVHKAARIMAAGHGGQVLVSAVTRQLVGNGFSLLPLGEHRLKDLSQPEPLFQLKSEGLPDSFPALKTLGDRPNNLPVVPTPFIGRQDELDKVRALLSRDDVRLLTLTGPGGIGKTRLGLQAAADATEQFPDGVFWVPLAAVRDAALVLPAVGRALGLREEAERPLLTAIAHYLRDKKLLLFLDNLEQVVEAAGEIAPLLQDAPQLRVLATSRETLRVRGEHLYDVPPMSLPADDDVAALQTFDAVQLFVARASAVDEGFAITQEEAPVIAAIVRRLDGIPLSLELAAARLRELPPRSLLRRLDDRLRVLTSGSRDGDERQRTLKATIAWSYELLSPEEQKLFARIGIFVGGCRIDAAEAVCDPDGTLEIPVLEGTSMLLQKSLLRRRTDPDGEPRYSMLETIRDYALKALETHGELDHLRRCHAQYFGAVAERALVPATTYPGVEEQFGGERSDVRAAVTWALEGAEPHLAMRLGLAYGLICERSGPIHDGQTVLESVLSSVGAFTQPWMQQRAHCSVANLAQRRGDLEVARAHAKHGLVLARRNEDSLGAAQALLLLGLIAADAGHPVRSEVLLLRALRLFEGRGDDRGVRVTLGLVAFLFMAQGRYAEAADSAARALELARVGNDGATTALAAGNLAHVRIKESRYEEALRLLDESLSITVSRGDVQGIAETLLDVAEMAIVVGAYESAHHFLQAIPVLAESVQFSLTPVEREWLDEMSDRVQKARGPVAPETRTDAATTTEAISEDAIRFIRSQLAEQTRPGGIW